MRIALFSLLLTGCVAGTRDSNIDDGSFRVMSDCEGNRVEVELNLNRAIDQKKIEVKQ